MYGASLERDCLAGKRGFHAMRSQADTEGSGSWHPEGGQRVACGAFQSCVPWMDAIAAIQGPCAPTPIAPLHLSNVWGRSRIAARHAKGMSARLPGTQEERAQYKAVPDFPSSSPYILNGTTFCCCWPRPSMPSVMTSPAFKNRGGFMPRPTPGGVPVVMTSPASSTMNCET